MVKSTHFALKEISIYFIHINNHFRKNKKLSTEVETD